MKTPTETPIETPIKTPTETPIETPIKTTSKTSSKSKKEPCNFGTKKHLTIIKAQTEFVEVIDVVMIFSYHSFDASILSIVNSDLIMSYAESGKINSPIKTIEAVYEHIIPRLIMTTKTDCEGFISSLMDRYEDRFEKVIKMALNTYPILKELIMKGGNDTIIDCLLTKDICVGFQKLEALVFRFKMFSGGIDEEYLEMIGRLRPEHIIIGVLKNAQPHLNIDMIRVLQLVLSRRGQSVYLNNKINEISAFVSERTSKKISGKG